MIGSTAAHIRSQARDFAALAAAALVAVGLGAGAFWVVDQQNRAAGWVGHTEQVLQRLASTRASLLGVENAYRGYVITADEPQLASYVEALAALDRQLATLHTLTSDNPPQQARLNELQSSLEPFLATTRAIVAARRSAGFEEAQRIIATATPREQSARLMTIVAGLEQEERRLLNERVGAHEARLQWATWTIAVLVAVLFAALLLVYAQERRRQDEQQALLRSEQRFHVLARSVVDYAILLLDPQGHVVSWNPGAERIKGYAEDEIIGQHFSRFYRKEDVEAGKPARELAVAAAEGQFEEEGWRVRKDGSRFWASVVVAALRDESGGLIGFGKVTRDLTERNRHEEALRKEVVERRRMADRLRELNDSLEDLVADRTAALNETNSELVEARSRLQDLSARLIAAQEEERHRIARDLHDQTGQALTTLRMRLAMALAHEDQRIAQIEECGLVIDEAVKQVRNMAQDLRPLVLDDLGLVDALEWLLERQAKLAGWSIRLKAERMEQRLVPAIETACFRITQEALTNVARHAAARHVEVELRSDDRTLELSILDDGKGFDALQAQSGDVRQRHFGLVSMTERAGLLGGRMEIRTAPGSGTRIQVTFPRELLQ